MPPGGEPRRTVSTEPFVGSTREMVSSWLLATHTAPSPTATPVGPAPTGDVFATAFAEGEMRKSVGCELPTNQTPDAPVVIDIVAEVTTPLTWTGSSTLSVSGSILVTPVLPPSQTAARVAAIENPSMPSTVPEGLASVGSMRLTFPNPCSSTQTAFGLTASRTGLAAGLNGVAPCSSRISFLTLPNSGSSSRTRSCLPLPLIPPTQTAPFPAAIPVIVPIPTPNEVYFPCLGIDLRYGARLWIGHPDRALARADQAGLEADGDLGDQLRGLRVNDPDRRRTNVREATSATAADGEDHGGDRGDRQQRSRREEERPAPAWRLGLRAQRREPRRQPFDRELRERLGLRKVLEPVQPEVEQSGSIMVGEERAGRRRQQHLTSVRGCADPRRARDCQPDVSVAGHLRVACVDAHAHPYLSTHGPGLHRQRPLGRRSGLYSVLGAGKDAEERLGLPIDDCSSVSGEGSLEQPPVRFGDLLVVVAEAVLQFGGPFNVREEQRDGAARQTRHRLRFVKRRRYFLQAATMSTP